MILLLGISGTLIGQPSVKITGVGHGRPGFSAGFTVEVIRGDLSGPVRVKLNLPKDWKAKSYGFDKRASIQQQGVETRILWLSMPIIDTVRYSFDVRIPESQPLQTESIDGVLEFFGDDGKKKSIPISSHQIKMMRYYSRYQ